MENSTSRRLAGIAFIPPLRNVSAKSAEVNSPSVGGAPHANQGILSDSKSNYAGKGGLDVNKAAGQGNRRGRPKVIHREAEAIADAIRTRLVPDEHAR